MQKQYKIMNKTTNQQETPWAENPEMLVSLYKSVGEDIEILDILQEGVDEEIYKPKPIDNIPLPDNTPSDSPSDSLSNQPTLPKHFEPHKPDQLFEMDGKQLKLSDGVLYHKVWMDVVNMGEYRIISQKTEKIITNEFKTLQKLKWAPVDGVGDNNV